MVSNILITGANGQLGSELKFLLKSENRTTAFKSANFFYTDQEELDITDLKAVESFVKTNSISIIINCAAYTAVDRAEDEPELCEKVNSLAPRNLAKAAKDSEALLIHISTDYVFDGNGPLPYKESDTREPKSVYGVTKAKGEDAVIKLADRYIIIRTSWLYSKYGNNFVKTISKLSCEKPSLTVVFDQIGTPTHATDLAEAIIEICSQYITKIEKKSQAQFPYGVYHYSNEGVCSWYDFALDIAANSCDECKVLPVTSEKFPTKAKRPPYSVMDKSKIKNTFAITIPHWRESLKHYFNSIEINNY